MAAAHHLALRVDKHLNINRVNYAVVNLSDLNRFEEGTEVTIDVLVATKMVRNVKDGVKVLGNGTLEKKLSVQANAFSKSAVEAIEKLGGKVEVI